MTGTDGPVPPRLDKADAWILAALTMQPDGRAPLQDVIAAMDFLRHALPTFDELSYGLRRLQVAGLLDVERQADDVLLVAAGTARRIHDASSGPRRGAHAVERDIAVRIGAVADEPADLAHGRCAELDEAVLERAVTAYRAMVRRPRRRRAGA